MMRTSPRTTRPNSNTGTQGSFYDQIWWRPRPVAYREARTLV